MLKFSETHIYTHLRKFHGLAPGGKNKTEATEPNFELIKLPLSSFNIREIFARYMSYMFAKLYEQWKNAGINVKFSCITTKNIETNSHQVEIQILSGVYNRFERFLFYPAFSKKIRINIFNIGEYWLYLLFFSVTHLYVI